MNIHHVVSSIDLSTGGPARSVTGIIKSMLISSQEINITLETLSSKNPIINSFEHDRAKIVFNDYSLFLFSRPLIEKLKTSNSDILHGHGIWQLPVHYMSKIARRKNTPYILTVRGMLEPWSLKQAELKKKIALNLFQYKDLVNASCLHATADMEVKSIRALGLKNPIAMIPNGIEISKFPNLLPKKDTKPRKLLFLSRIHKKKGIENLIEAWGNINKEIRENWIIEIIGNGEINYIKELQKRILLKNLEDSIYIKKPVFGKKKLEIFRKASLFVLPTFSENFGIVVAEALASYTPVITTKGTPWEIIENHKCGWWIDIGVKPLEVALTKALKMKDKDISLMGENGRELIEKEFSMESVANKMISLYNWVLKKGEKPTFVNIYE